MHFYNEFNDFNGDVDDPNVLGDFVEIGETVGEIDLHDFQWNLKAESEFLSEVQ